MVEEKIIEEKVNIDETTAKLTNEQLKNTPMFIINLHERIDKKMEIKDQIRNITEQLKKYKTIKNNYLLDNVPYIFNYFEEKKKISVGESENKIILNSFFKIKSEKDVVSNLKYQNSKNFYQNYKLF